ncbi:MAG TPA: hypothetical protein VG324_13970 [Blastocatellia bacterium]|nr:hypothetical protein [Blastocatellia bacterium]
MIEDIGLKTRFGKMLTALSHLPRAIALVWGATRNWTAAWALLLLLRLFRLIGKFASRR